MPAETVLGGLQATTDAELDGLDALSGLAQRGAAGAPVWRRAWQAGWPKLAAVALALALWQLVASSGWRPSYILPGPVPVLHQLADSLTGGDFWQRVAWTGRRALVGYAVAVAIGSALGLAVARIPVVRAAFGSLLTGLQSMPSITWFPLALLLFRESETSITFVVVFGAAPSIANGLIDGVDTIPPLLVRSGRALGASGLALLRFVIVPAALPGFVGGLKQGWSFAWRSLMAGELLVIIAGHPSVGAAMKNAQDLNDYQTLIVWMIVVLLVGMGVNGIFSLANGALRRRWGLRAA